MGREPLPSALPAPELLSVIIPARDAATLLPGQLAALSRQDHTGSWEVIVADNGSTDETAATALRWADRLPGLRVVAASARPGINHARNIGAVTARGDVLVFCDADDTATPGWLRAMARAAGTAHLVGGYPAPYTTANHHARSWRTPQPRDRLPVALDYLPFAMGCSLGVRTNVYHALGGFDEGYAGGGDEVEFCWRALLADYTLAYAPDAVMRYRLRERLGPLVRQAYGYGVGNARLMRDFRIHGLPAVAPAEAARTWLRLLRRLPELADREQAGRWCFDTAFRVGRLNGSIRYRVPCL
ncbi:glycosyltransferase family 2 protein [Kitasatospora griseola]